jgi:hypothetical protein
MRGTGACAGSCDDLAVTEGQIAIGNRDHDLTEILGETERPLSIKSRKSPRGDQVAANVTNPRVETPREQSGHVAAHFMAHMRSPGEQLQVFSFFLGGFFSAAGSGAGSGLAEGFSAGFSAGAEAFALV